MALFDLAFLHSVSIIIQNGNKCLRKKNLQKKFFCFYFVTTNLQVYAVRQVSHQQFLTEIKLQHSFLLFSVLIKNIHPLMY